MLAWKLCSWNTMSCWPPHLSLVFSHALEPVVLLQASDGKRLAMLDEQGNLLKALAPPQFPRPAHRPYAVGPAYEVRAKKQNMASTCT
jgi:hypothetical protein